MLVTALGDIVTVPRHADSADKAEADSRVALRLVYDRDTESVRAAARTVKIKCPKPSWP
jgi:hypothetical protein